MTEEKIFKNKAVAAYAQGLGIIPLIPGTKLPHAELLPKTKNGAAVWTPFKSERATQAQMDEWAEQCPHANYGITCGSPSTIDGHYVYVLDVEDRGRFNDMYQQVVDLYGETYSVLSRRGGHIYLLSLEPVQSRNCYREKLQFEIKGHGAYVLGEGCRHPDGGYYELHSSPEKIVRADTIPFCPLEYFLFKEFGSGGLLLAYRIIRRKHRQALEGYFKGGSKVYDRSRVMQSVVTSCRNQDIAKDIVQRALESVALGTDASGVKFLTHYQAQLQEHGEYAAQRALKRAWDYAGRRPLTPEAIAAVRHMDELSTWVQNKPWSGHSNLLMRDVLMAHISRCYKACNDVYHLDIRSGAEMAQCHHMTFSKKTALLCQAGFLVLVEPAKNSTPNSYRLDFDKFQNDALAAEFFHFETLPTPSLGSPCLEVEEFSNPDQTALNPLTPIGDAQDNLHLNERTSPNRFYGVFAWGGLGRGAEQVWLCLRGQMLLPKDIGIRTRHNSGAVSRYLKKLREAGLVVTKGRLYSAVENPDFKKISQQMGTYDRADCRHSRHERHRSEFLARQKPAPDKPAPDKLAPDKLASRKLVPGKLASEKPISDEDEAV